MQLQGIFITIVVFFCIHGRIQAKPSIKKKISSAENINNIEPIETTSDFIACRDSSQCPAHSQCQGGVCECVIGYTTWKNGTFCAYEQRSKWVAFAVSFLAGSIGVDWFYLSRGNPGYIVAGIFKLVLWFGCCFRFCKRDGNLLVLYCIIIGVCLSVGSGIWWLIDWIRILTGVFFDENGAPLSDAI